MHVKVMIIYKSLLQDEATDLEKAEQILSEEPSTQDGLSLRCFLVIICVLCALEDIEMEPKTRKSALKEVPCETNLIHKLCVTL